MSTLFRNYTFTWWQMAILKIALFSIGMIAGALLATFVIGWLWLFIGLAVVGSGYILVHSFRSPAPKN